MKQNNHHLIRIATIFAALLAMAALSACGSKDTAAPAAESTQTAEAQTEASQATDVKVETTQAEQAKPEVDNADASQSTDAETDTASTGKGPIKEADMKNPEPVQYEGIDLTSTLPATEWLKTFSGTIDVPKFIICNDDTNYKVIAEDGQRIKFHRDDKVLLYCPVSACDSLNATLGYFNYDEDYDFLIDSGISCTGYYNLDDDIWADGEMELFFSSHIADDENEWNNDEIKIAEDEQTECDITLVFVD